MLGWEGRRQGKGIRELRKFKKKRREEMKLGRRKRRRSWKRGKGS